ncbi:unnamed protein product [Gulo gulo]|uniref:Uncharacterized protein n=1 Tax=Gulo gulo TaxID=48420 RepID=A0A9X9M795_GULGU|nr:unnamed protein product [Gulo gulo]
MTGQAFRNFLLFFDCFS